LIIHNKSHHYSKTQNYFN